MFFAVKPILVRYAEWMDRTDASLPAYAIASVYVMILSSAAATEWIGIHAIFGAFLLGVVIPSECRLAKSFLMKLKEPVTVLLLPAFFAYTGMRTQLGLLSGWNHWMVCLAIILVATVGKFGGDTVSCSIRRRIVAGRRDSWNANEYTGPYGTDSSQYRT